MLVCSGAHRLNALRIARSAVSGLANRPAMADTPGIGAEKTRLRNDMKERLRRMSPDQMAEESASIAAHVLAAPFFKAAARLAVYVHCPRLREVDTSGIVATVLASDAK
jgi:hypothetical protein